MASDMIEWRFTPAERTGLRVAMYAWIGFFAGGALAIGTFIVGAIVSGILDGGLTVGSLALVTLLLFAGGTAPLLYYIAITRPTSYADIIDALFPHTGPRNTWTFIDPDDVRSISNRGLFIATVCSALALVVFAIIDVRLIAVFGIVIFTSLILSSVLYGWGRIDPTTPLFEYNDTTIPVDAIDDVFTLPIGPYLICWLRYEPGVKHVSLPSLITISREAQPTLDRARANADDHDDERVETHQAVRITALLVGCSFFAIGLIAWAIMDVPFLVGLYFFVFLAFFGGFFLWAGWTLR